MFSLKNFKLVKEIKNINPHSKWLKFSNPINTNNAFLKELISDNKFIEEDLKIRAMVEKMLSEEFSDAVKDKKSYDYLVDMVVMRLKQKQMGKITPIEE